MAHSSDDEDYMSDNFLLKCEDKRPGLVSKQVARQHKGEARHKQGNLIHRTKSKAVMEHENREEGLTKALDKTNKGFALLSKMGYKPGMSLGKSGDGRKEPVPVQVRAHRGGLGIENKRKRQQADMEAMRARMAAKRAHLATDYRARLAEQREGKEIERDLRSSQSVCFQLDSEQGMTEPDLRFYWPASAFPSKVTGEDEEEGEDKREDEGEDKEEEEEEQFEGCELSPMEQLQEVTLYLRRNYLYCVWCGTKYEDSEDFKSNCPGDSRGAHDD